VPPRPLDELRVENFLPSVQTLHVGPPVEALCHLFPVLALVLHDKRSQPLVLLLGPFALALFTVFSGLDGGVVRKHAARQHALGGHYDCLPALSRCRCDLAAGHAAACRAAPRPVRPRVPEGDTKPNSMRKGAIWSPAGPHVARPCQRRLCVGLAPLTSHNTYLLWAAAARMARRRHLWTAPFRGACPEGRVAGSWATCRRTRHVRSRARKLRA
jgi:hypothetical protein